MPPNSGQLFQQHFHLSQVCCVDAQSVAETRRARSAVVSGSASTERRTDLGMLSLVEAETQEYRRTDTEGDQGEEGVERA